MKLIAGIGSLGATVSAALVFVACSGSDDGGAKNGEGDAGAGGSSAAGGSEGAGGASAGGSGAGGEAPAAGGSGAGGGGNECADAGNGRCVVGCTHPTLPQCGTWVPVSPGGNSVCSDGSPYKFFVNYSATSDNLVISFEPGGACWDYESCSGAGGIRGAVNRNGIQDDHMSTYQFLNHLAVSEQNPLHDWNKVFVAYCTGDVHTGNNEMVYENTEVDGGPPLTYRHRGHDNVQAVVGWLAQTFQSVPKMFVTGCSAGGAGSLLNYHFIRKGMGSQVEKSYLLDDSGPIFDSSGPSAQVHAKIRSSWNVDPIIDSLEGDLPVTAAEIKANFGLINTALADTYPNDRLAFTAYWMDFNYSLYSYQRFFPGSTEQEIHDFWRADIETMMARFDAEPNMAYYIPYFRADNCSHCVSIPPLDNLDKVATEAWWGTEIQADSVTLRDFTVDLIDDTKPLRNYVEEIQPTEVFTPEKSLECMEGGGTIPGQP